MAFVNATFLEAHPQSVFEDFESYFIAKGIPEDDNNSLLKNYKLVFLNCDRTPDIYEIQDFSSALGLVSKVTERTVPASSVLTIRNEVVDIINKTEIYLTLATEKFE